MWRELATRKYSCTRDNITIPTQNTVPHLLCYSSLCSIVILKFDKTQYQFIEGETIELVVTKYAPLATELTFIVSHDELSVIGTFAAGANAITVSFFSSDDEIALEPDEEFSIELSLVEPNPQIILHKPFANMTIIDDDSE